MKAYHWSLTGDFGFWIMTSEKPSEARSHPSGCLVGRRNGERPEEKCACFTRRALTKCHVLMKNRNSVNGFRNETDDEAVSNRLVRRHNSLYVFRWL